MSLRVFEVVRDPEGSDPQTLEGQSRYGFFSVIPLKKGIHKKAKAKIKVKT